MSALADVVLPTHDTPQGTAIRIASYITCDATVAMHVNRLHGTNMKPARVARIRYERSIGLSRAEKAMRDAEPEPSDMPKRINAARKANDAFRNAVLKAAGK